MKPAHGLSLTQYQFSTQMFFLQLVTFMTLGPYMAQDQT